MDANIIITDYKSNRLSFLLEEGALTKVSFLNPESLVGNIYTAKVVNIVKSINAAFLDVGTGDYLYYSLIDNEGKNIFLQHGNTDKVCVGDELLVQVSMDPIKTKKGVATSDITLKGRYIILNRSGEIGISKKISDPEKRNELIRTVGDICADGAIIRTAAAEAATDELIKDAEELVALFNKIQKKAENSLCKKLIHSSTYNYSNEIEDIVLKNKYESFKVITDKEDIYDELKTRIDGRFLYFYDDEMVSLEKLYSLETRLEKGFNRTVYLKSGGSIVVEPTEALTVFDVNTGKLIKGKNVEATFLKINKEAAKEIVRIIRLRNISGIIIIDFINMKDNNKISELISYLKNELSKDEVVVKYVDITALGLVEITRKKILSPYSLKMFEKGNI